MSNNNGEKILILSGRFGEGHLQAAKAIEEAAKLKYPEFQARVIDFMEWAHPNLFPVTQYVYMKGIKTFPQLYGFIYNKTYTRNSFSKKLNAAFSIGLRKMLVLLEKEKPTVVVSTYPFVSSILSKLKETGLTNVPFVTVITDHTHHSYWIYPYTDQYIVGSNKIKEKLIHLGIPSERVSSTGIPIRMSFLEQKDRSNLIKKYKLDSNLPIVLIMGGGEGLLGKGMFDTETMEQFPEPLQLLVLYGHNEKLRERLQKEFVSTKHRLHLIGYTERIDEVMAISDVLITKPGGVTTSEALAMELPMLLYKGLPGQEQDNARYLVESGTAIQAGNPSELYRQLNNLIKNHELAAGMKENCRRIRTNEAAFSALAQITQNLISRPVFFADDFRESRFRPFRSLRKTPLHG